MECRCEPSAKRTPTSEPFFQLTCLPQAFCSPGRLHSARVLAPNGCAGRILERSRACRWDSTSSRFLKSLVGQPRADQADSVRADCSCEERNFLGTRKRAIG